MFSWFVISMIIGITGTNGAGKDTIVRFFQGKGFQMYSCSDILRDECKQRGWDITRDHLIEIADTMREQEGYGVLAERVVEKIIKDNPGKTVVNSVRHPGEVEILRKQDNFLFISVDAPIEMRYQRIIGRNQNKEDDVSFEEFTKQERLVGEGGQQQLAPTMDLADISILNASTLKDFHEQLEEIYERLT